MRIGVFLTPSSEHESRKLQTAIRDLEIKKDLEIWAENIYERIMQVAADSWAFIVKYSGKVALFSVASWNAFNEFSGQHPYIALFTCLLISIRPHIALFPWFAFQGVVAFVLKGLGFGPSGIIRLSLIALFQSRRYGGDTPWNSIFSRIQSEGTRRDDILPEVGPGWPFRDSDWEAEESTLKWIRRLAMIVDLYISYFFLFYPLLILCFLYICLFLALICFSSSAPDQEPLLPQQS